MTPTAELEEIRRRHARVENPGGTWSNERVLLEGVTAHDDRARLLAILDGLMEKLTERDLAEVLFNLTFGGTDDPTLTEMAKAIAYNQARAIRQHLSLAAPDKQEAK